MDGVAGGRHTPVGSYFARARTFRARDDGAANRCRGFSPGEFADCLLGWFGVHVAGAEREGGAP